MIASGGVGNLEHLYQGIAEGHAEAVLAASIFHFGEATVGQAHDYLRARGVPVRDQGRNDRTSVRTALLAAVKLRRATGWCR